MSGRFFDVLRTRIHHSRQRTAFDDRTAPRLDLERLEDRITPSGIITTIAGNGVSGNSGDGGQATAAMLSPKDVAADDSGHLFVLDAVYSVVRQVTLSTGLITTIAGNSA